MDSVTEAQTEETKAFIKCITTSDDHLEYVRNEDNFEAHALLFKRKFELNRLFVFDDAAINKLLRLNAYLKVKQLEIYRRVVLIENDLKKQAAFNGNWFKSYAISVDCSVYNSKLFRNNNALYTRPLFRSNNLFFFNGTNVEENPKIGRFFHSDITSALYDNVLFKCKHSAFFGCCTLVLGWPGRKC